MTTTEDTITFLSNHQPVLADGNYQISLTQTITIPGEQVNPPAAVYTFTIAGERFALKPADVNAVFPPAGSMGDHSHVMPHIILNHSTLPWERSAGPGAVNAPWLALLLFDEAETPLPQVKTLAEIRADPLLATYYPAEPGEDANKQVTLIQVSVPLLKRILPSAEALAWLAHVRVRAGVEAAVILGSRVPEQGGTSTVHLVALEGRYLSAGFDFPAGAQTLSLVSLYSWRFTCADSQHDFIHLLMNLDAKTLRLPRNTDPGYEKSMARGCALLPHYLRSGALAGSWYHGPLIPGGAHSADLPAPALPALCADSLYRLKAVTGELNVSYAAAWELGRLLGLQSATYSSDLFLWKRAQAEIQRAAEQTPPGTLAAQPAAAPDLPPSVQNWFTSLERLEGVPFRYLVPDEAMLLPETLAFFFLDWSWLDCLRDGAFSLGRVSNADFRLDKMLAARYLPGHAKAQTGFLLRSEVVAGWPGLMVAGYDQKEAQLTLLRMERVAQQTLLCLFDGVVSMVDLYLKPESMHFELASLPASLSNAENSPEAPWSMRLDWSKEGSRVITLANTGGEPTSAKFAAQMIRAGGKVRFTI